MLHVINVARHVLVPGFRRVSKTEKAPSALHNATVNVQKLLVDFDLYALQLFFYIVASYKELQYDMIYLSWTPKLHT